MVRPWLLACTLVLSSQTPLVGAPDDPVAAALIQKRHHHFQAAEQSLAALLARDPDHLAANLLLGSMRHYCGDLQGGFACIQRAAIAHPGDLEAQVMLAHAYLWLDRIEDAEKQANKTIAAWEGKDPDRALWARLLVALGGAQGLRAKKEGGWAALKDGLAVRGTFERALRADPDGAVPLYALGRYYLEAPALAGGDPRKGLEYVRRAMRRDPESHAMRAYYVQVLAQQGQKDAARAELVAYQRQFSDVPGALLAVQSLAARIR